MSKSELYLILDDLKKWRKYQKDLCATCMGSCCYMPVEIPIEDLYTYGLLDEFYKELSIEEQIKTALKIKTIKRYTPSSKKFTLVQKPDNSCIYLDSKGLCTIYENRFSTCRNHPKIGPKSGFCAYVKK